jgi:regulator of sigma D
MSVKAQSDPVHSKAVPDLLAKLLVERQEMLVLFNRLVVRKPYAAIAALRPLLQRFCQVLVDYIALGHFEVFECLEDDAGDTKCFRRIKRLAKELYPRIAVTTQLALDFNDRYDFKKRCETLDTLYSDLSRLGEQLAIRIELEDRLLSAIKSPSKEPSQRSIAAQPD